MEDAAKATNSRQTQHLSLYVVLRIEPRPHTCQILISIRALDTICLQPYEELELEQSSQIFSEFPNDRNWKAKKIAKAHETSHLHLQEAIGEMCVNQISMEAVG
ncbi:uncharacterized protein LOC144375302 [Ictidomys tridecemlineatus]